MTKSFFIYLRKQFSTQTYDINRLFISAFLCLNDIKIKNNTFLKKYIIEKSDSNEYKNLEDLLEYFKVNEVELDFELLIELFEFVISPSDKIVNGAVYTPKHIRDFIVEKSLEKSNINLNNVLIVDIACGCGCFLYTVAQILKEKTKNSYKYIFKNNLFGNDIAKYSIERTEIILSLWAILDGEDEDFDFNLYLGNSLSFDWKFHNNVVNENGGFDLILGNPPYVSSKNISYESRELLINWSVSQVGNPDLYIPFFQVGFQNLAPNGVLGYITINSFIRSLNGRNLREFFSSNKIPLDIYDFGNEQVFKRRLTYTCICILQKTELNYVRYNKTSVALLRHKQNLSIHEYSILNTKNGWNLGTVEVSSIIEKIQKIGIPLGEYCQIRNGFATLKNNVYLFTPTHEDDYYYYTVYSGKKIRIEKGICRDAIKPNILRSEGDIVKYKEKIIFPYKTDTSYQTSLFSNSATISLITENHFKENFPEAYHYLQLHKITLSQRDKGKGKYGAWYAYGRNQALTINGYKLLFPYIADKPYFFYTDQKDLLFYNGYAIVSEDIIKLKILQKILQSSIFWFYIIHSSKPYTHNYFALAKNFIKDFGICDLNGSEKDFLLKNTSSEVIDEFLFKKYGIGSKIRKVMKNIILTSTN